jgi:hypothetical protein
MKKTDLTQHKKALVEKKQDLESIGMKGMLLGGPHGQAW